MSDVDKVLADTVQCVADATGLTVAQLMGNTDSCYDLGDMYPAYYHVSKARKRYDRNEHRDAYRLPYWVPHRTTRDKKREKNRARGRIKVSRIVHVSFIAAGSVHVSKLPGIIIHE